MMHALETLSYRLDSNPRRLKRIINVLQIISEVSKIKPLHESKPRELLIHHANWEDFSQKVVQWIFLCEMFPYRMSFLVQILMDYDQKRDFNSLIKKVAHNTIILPPTPQSIKSKDQILFVGDIEINDGSSNNSSVVMEYLPVKLPNTPTSASTASANASAAPIPNIKDLHTFTSELECM